jgi:hypothetical protein
MGGWMGFPETENYCFGKKYRSPSSHPSTLTIRKSLSDFAYALNFGIMVHR